MQSTQTQVGYCEDVTGEDRRKIDAQLERLLLHPLFRQSKRLPAFLRFVVQESLTNKGDGPPKERTLGIAVFGRKPDYDTATDPVVRVTATELRKKLAQYYYEEGHLEEIRIELPPGSYLPKFRKSTVEAIPPAAGQEELQQSSPLFAAEPELIDHVLEQESSLITGTAMHEQSAPVPAEIAQVSSRRSVWQLTLAILAAVLLGALTRYVPLPFASHGSSISRFWSSFVGKSPQVLIVMPVIASEEHMPARPSDASVAGNLSIEDANIAARVAAQLEMQKSPYRLVSASELNFGDLRGVPAVLIGALDNVWTMRLCKGLPFAFEESPDGRTGRIVDTKDPAHRSWSLDITTPHLHITKDYGIVARYRDSMTGEAVLVLAGISSQGTQAAGETVTNPEYLDSAFASAIKTNSNIEVIVETAAIDGRSGPPRVVASRTW